MTNEDEETTPLEVHRVVLMIIDDDRLGAAGVAEVLENARYPNRCLSPDVLEVQSRTVEWSDDHPLNFSSTKKAAFAELFATSTEETP